MPKNRKHFYLTNSERIKGLRFCYNNSVSLLEEAIYLQKNQKWARATALAILGLEEMAKIELIGKSFFIKDQTGWKKFEKKFLSHNEKLITVDSLLVQILLRKRKENEFNEILDEIFNGRNLNLAKQKCFYVGYSLQYGWEVPLNFVNEQDSIDYIHLLQLVKESYYKIFSGSDNELVDMIKNLRKPTPSKEADNFNKELRMKVIKKYEEITKTKYSGS